MKNKTLNYFIVITSIIISKICLGMEEKATDSASDYKNICKERQLFQCNSLKYLALKQLAQLASSDNKTKSKILKKLESLPQQFQILFKLLSEKNYSLTPKKSRFKKIHDFFKDQTAFASLEDILVTALFYSDYDLLNFLLSDAQVNFNCLATLYDKTYRRSENKQLSMLMVACFIGDIDTITKLLESGIDISKQDEFHFTALSYAIMQKIPNVIFVALTKINVLPKENLSNVIVYPIDQKIYNLFALRPINKKNPEILELLLNYKNVEFNDLKFAISMFNIEATKILLNHSKLDVENIRKLKNFCIQTISRMDNKIYTKKNIKKKIDEITENLEEILKLLNKKIESKEEIG